MAKSVGTLAVNIVARTKSFAQGLSKATTRLKRFGSGIATVSKRVAGFGVALTGVAAGGMALLIKSQLKAIDALAKTADKIGATTEGLAGLRHAASITGIETRTLDMALQRMTRRIAEAAKGTGEAKAAIAELGLDAKRLSNLKTEDSFREIAKAMQRVKKPADKLRLAFKLFDSEGAALVNTLALGADGLDRMTEEAKSLGLAFSREEAAKVEKFNDEMTRLSALVGGFGRTIVIDIAPAASEFVEGLRLWMQERKRKRVAAGGSEKGFLRKAYEQGIIHQTGLAIGRSMFSELGKNDPRFGPNPNKAQNPPELFNQFASAAIRTVDAKAQARNVAAYQKWLGEMISPAIGNLPRQIGELGKGTVGLVGKLGDVKRSLERKGFLQSLFGSAVGGGTGGALQPAPAFTGATGAALERGTAAAFSAQRRGHRDPIKDVAETSKKQLKEDQESVKQLKVIAERVGPNLVHMVAIPAL